MGLIDAVTEAFAVDGSIARAVQEFSPRAGQLEMAQAVAQTLESGGVLVVEAGTGIGKTYAYLAPALLSGVRVLVSTATKALQDQLFGRDIPKLLAALGVGARVALLKGRASYLCLQRLGVARYGSTLQTPDDLRAIAAVEYWALSTRTGDLAELASVDEQSPVIPLVTSTRENCQGGRCPQYQSCHVYQARRDAMAADVVVINHHLFFADWNVKESGVAELLPTVDAVIFDEAHQLNEIGVQFLGQQLTTGQLLSLGRDVMALGSQHARGLADWQGLVGYLENTLAEWQLLCPGRADMPTRLRWVGDAPAGISTQAWSQAMGRVTAVLARVLQAIDLVVEMSPDLGALRERTQALADRLEGFAAPPPAGHVRWLEAGLRLRMVESPLQIADALRAKVAGDGGMDEGRKSWVFTSATLGHEAGLQWFLASTGLEGARVLQVTSPFNYLEQAALYVPKIFPKPSEPQHSDQVAELVAQAAGVLGGRTLVLTTTLRAMRRIGQRLRELWGSASAIQVLVQGDGSKRELIERFASASDAAGCVLVASASFWEGVDVPGAALQLVVIDKIPFAPPDDPLVEARCQALEEEGKSAFAHYQLPQAAVALKQGVGRLIRRETDRGVLVLCDVRLAQMGYGRKLLASLPPMRRLDSAEAFQQALQSLTKPSTKDPY